MEMRTRIPGAYLDVAIRYRNATLGRPVVPCPLSWILSTELGSLKIAQLSEIDHVPATTVVSDVNLFWFFSQSWECGERSQAAERGTLLHFVVGDPLENTRECSHVSESGV
jgi:hypothetical protein